MEAVKQMFYAFRDRTDTVGSGSHEIGLLQSAPPQRAKRAESRDLLGAECGADALLPQVRRPH